jgi:hypothetical protein
MMPRAVSKVRQHAQRSELPSPVLVLGYICPRATVPIPFHFHSSTSDGHTRPGAELQGGPCGPRTTLSFGPEAQYQFSAKVELPKPN